MKKSDTDGDAQRKNVRAYLKYSGLAFQMAGVVIISLFLGKWTDKFFGLQKPLFTIILVLLFFSAFMYKLYKELSQK